MLALLAKRFACPKPSLCSIARRTAIKAATLRQDLRIVTEKMGLKPRPSLDGFWCGIVRNSG